MFAYISGKLVVKSEGFVVIDAGGIGYKIFMSESSLSKLEEVGSIVKVHTHYYVREDNISLYGFYSADELRMFELLLSVSGIGAKSAIAMLSAISPSEFAIAIISNNISRLTGIPGIGTKTAQRIVLELKDKIKNEEGVNYIEMGRCICPDDTDALLQCREEVIAALKVLGYGKKEIDDAISKVDMDNVELEDIIKKALSYLAG